MTYMDDAIVCSRLAKALRSIRNVRKQILALSDDVRLDSLVRACEALNKKLACIHHGFEIANQIRKRPC